MRALFGLCCKIAVSSSMAQRSQLSPEAMHCFPCIHVGWPRCMGPSKARLQVWTLATLSKCNHGVRSGGVGVRCIAASALRYDGMCQGS